MNNIKRLHPNVLPLICSPMPHTSTSFHNLSQIENLSQYHHLFDLGLKHIPIPKRPQAVKYLDYWNSFRNTIYWTEFWFKHPAPYRDYNPNIPTLSKSSIPEDLLRKSHIHSTVDLTMETLMHLHVTLPNPTRLNTRELQLISKLRKDNPLVVFTETDKNLGLAALSIDDYHASIMQHLSDCNNYTLLFQDAKHWSTFIPVDDAFTKVIALARKLSLTDQERKYLSSWTSFSIPQFRVIPKIHKAKKNGLFPSRPIACNTNWITTPLSVILNEKLKCLATKPHVNVMKSVLKDSCELVQIFRDNPQVNSFPHTARLISFDVVALYPNINNKKLSESLRAYHPPLADAFEMITESNYVQYGNSVYKQTHGLPMGTNCAVTLANWYLGTYLDPTIRVTGGVFFYKRYIDDCFIIADWSDTDINCILTVLHMIDPRLKFTVVKSDTTIEVLDLKISFNPLPNGMKRLIFSVFQKQLNLYNYITPRSCHPRSTLSGFIKGELLRYSRICTLASDFLTIKAQFRQRLISRGYSPKFLQPIFDTIGPHVPIVAKTKRPANRLCLPFYPTSEDIALQKCLKKAASPLYIHTGKSFSITFSCSPNLQRHLTQSSLSKEQIEHLKL